MIDDLAERLVSGRVGGDYWGEQPVMPAAPYIVIRPHDGAGLVTVLGALPRDQSIVCWVMDGEIGRVQHPRLHLIRGRCDPWHILAGASELYSQQDDEVAAIATLMGISVRASNLGASTRAPARDRLELVRFRLIGPYDFFSPFTGEPISPLDSVELSAHWRALIDSNRSVSAAAGFASWKRKTVGPLLWGGSASFPPPPRNVATGDRIFAWKARIAPAKLAQLEGEGVELVEVEDGFIRSVGLGADCVPPLSIVVDALGAYFDPRQPSELELLIQDGEFPAELLDRAKRLRDLVVEASISKYGGGHETIGRRVADRVHLLVPGQVEDDRSVQCGGGDVQTNLELLRRARRASPGAYILYKPHPDVEAGHRVGAVADEQVARFADEIIRNVPITSLIEMVDDVHVNTSLAGFEALLRNKAVTTHGVPFYAGWGLTRDLGDVPRRRSARRTLDELVAAALLLYPRYLDPVSGLPCTPEVLIRRLAEGTGALSDGLLVRLRRLQGLFNLHSGSNRA